MQCLIMTRITKYGNGNTYLGKKIVPYYLAKNLAENWIKDGGQPSVVDNGNLLTTNTSNKSIYLN